MRKEIAKISRESSGIMTEDMPYVHVTNPLSKASQTIVAGNRFYLDVMHIAEQLGLKNPKRAVKKYCPNAFEIEAADKKGNIDTYTVDTVEGAAPLFHAPGRDPGQDLLKCLILDMSIENTLRHLRLKRDYMAPQKKKAWSFDEKGFGQLDVLTIDDEPWFVGKHVAEILGYTNTRDALSKHVEDEDKGVAFCNTPGGKQKMAIINEPGLYSLIFGSKLPQAKAFKRWVTKEVLPSIRKTSGYSVWGTPMQDPVYSQYALIMTDDNNTPRYKIKQLADLYIRTAGIAPKEAYNNLVDYIDRKYRMYRYEGMSLREVKEAKEDREGKKVTWPEFFGYGRCNAETEKAFAALEDLIYQAAEGKRAAALGVSPASIKGRKT